MADVQRDIFFNGNNLAEVTSLQITHILANTTPAIDIGSSKYQFADGAVHQKHNYGSKIIAVKGVFKGDRDAFDVGRAELEALLYNKIAKNLQYEDNGELLTYMATMRSLTIDEPQGGLAMITILFETTTPFYTKGSIQTTNGTVNGGVSVSLGTVGGNIKAKPTITIDINTWTGSGSTDTQTIAVTWTDGFCNVIGVFSVNDQIIIDIDTGQVTLNGEGVLYHSDFGGLSVGSNSITAECSAVTDNYDIQVDYYKRYI